MVEKQIQNIGEYLTQKIAEFDWCFPCLHLQTTSGTIIGAWLGGRKSDFKANIPKRIYWNVPSPDPFKMLLA